MDIKVTGQGGQNNLQINNKKVDEINRDVTKIADKHQSNMSKEDNNKEIKNAIKKLNTFLEDDNTHAEISVYDKMNRIMVKIVDDKTDKVIMEVPSEKVLDMVTKMCELAGVLVDKKA